MRTRRREASPIGRRGWSKPARGQRSSKYTHTHTYRQTDRGGYGEGRRVVLGRAEVLLMQRRAWIIHWERLSTRENPTANVLVRKLDRSM